MKKLMLILVALATLISASTIAKAAGSGLLTDTFEVKSLDTIKESDLDPALAGDGKFCTLSLTKKDAGIYDVVYALGKCEDPGSNTTRELKTFQGKIAFQIPTTDQSGNLTGRKAWMVQQHASDYDPVLEEVRDGNDAAAAAAAAQQTADAIRDCKDRAQKLFDRAETKAIKDCKNQTADAIDDDRRLGDRIEILVDLGYEFKEGKNDEQRDLYDTASKYGRKLFAGGDVQDLSLKMSIEDARCEAIDLGDTLSVMETSCEIDPVGTSKKLSGN